MLKTVLSVALVLAIALGGGTGSAFLALEATRMAGAVEIGAWTAFPEAGTPRADPYSRARTARRGALTLGQAEGVAFVADRDSAGAPLRRQCSYRLGGALPPVRFFTLHAADPALRALPAPADFSAALHSQALLWTQDEPLAVQLSPHPRAGNWLAVSGRGPMRLVLTLFDTPVSAGARVEQIALPRIVRTGCDDG